MAYVSNLAMGIRRTFAKAVMFISLLTMFNNYASAKSFEKPDDYHDKNRIEYVVQRGDNLYNIARNTLDENNPSIESIVNETDRIAGINDIGTIAEFPWHENYRCSGTSGNDPNCIYPGQELILEQAYAPPTAEPAPVSDSEPYENKTNSPLVYSFLLGVAAGIGGTILGTRKKNKKRQELEDIIALKNENPSASISSLVKNTDYSEEDLKRRFNTYFDSYSPDKFNTRIERYDHSIAPDAMKRDMVEMYQDSEHSLDAVSEMLSERYGMNVSASTISRYARKELRVNSRKEAREKNCEEKDMKTEAQPAYLSPSPLAPMTTFIF